MNKNMLWIEDDYYHYQNLLRPLELKGIGISYALTALEGYNLAKKWKQFDLLLIDIIVRLKRESGPIPDIVLEWNQEKHAGVGLIKWICQEVKGKIPIVILSIYDDPVEEFNLHAYEIADVIQKRGLHSTILAETLLKYLGEEN